MTGAHADAQTMKNVARMKKITILSKKNHKTLADSKNSRTFATAIEKQTMQAILVPWMSGLVSGLQNRVRRFESARNLKRKEVWVSG